VHPRDRLSVRRAIDHDFEHHVEVREEFRLKSRDGQYRSYSTVAQPLFDVANQPRGLVGVTQDVTTRRKAEQQLRRSEELLRATTENTADTLILVDTDLRVRFINRPVPELAVDTIIGETIAVLLPTAARDAVMARLRAVLATGETATYEFDVAGTEGAARHFENRAMLVRDGGIGTGISIAMRDITERRRLEREVLEISSRERHRIGRDLHDGLGQELTGVALMLRGLAQRLKRQSPDSINDINDIVALVNQSIETTRSLARGLLPVSTDDGGLSLALRTLVGRCRDSYGIDVGYREDLAPALPMPEGTASHLYRIAQEALTNTARHGHASHASVRLEVGPTRFMLCIADDGGGIATHNNGGPGMGLKIMQYRASMIGAKLEILPNVPRGTMVRVTREQPASSSELPFSHAT
jgi:PAS domain S-box-containing protein